MGANKEEDMIKPSNRCDFCGRYRRGGLMGFMQHSAICPAEKIWVITESGFMEYVQITRREYDRRLTNKEK